MKLIGVIILSTSIVGILSFNRNLMSKRSLNSVHSRATTITGRSQGNFPSTIAMASSKNDNLVGEDAASFSLDDQSTKSWAIFVGAVGVVITFLFSVWIWDGGPQLGVSFKDTMEMIANKDSTLTIIYMLGFFAVAHSGLASLRPAAEEIIGARAWRVIFALVSLPLAFSSIVYFINHR